MDYTKTEQLTLQEERSMVKGFIIELAMFLTHARQNIFKMNWLSTFKDRIT